MDIPNIIAIVVAMLAMSTSVFLYWYGDEMEIQDAASKPAKYLQRVHHIDAFQLYDVIKNPKEPVFQGAPNNEKIVWALFFHKPYCGSCRRVRPVFEALGSLVEETHTLRFAAIDCVKYRIFCDKEGIDKQPRIALYHPTKSSKGVSRAQNGVWSGMLMPWEVFNWFKTMQHQGKIPSKVKWPSDDALAKALLDFKAKGNSQVDTVAMDQNRNATGYLTDIELALHQGLVDAIFKGQTELSGARLRVLLKWLEVLGRAYPAASMRKKVLELRDALKQQQKWFQDDYERVVKGWGQRDVDDNEWQWCKLTGPGVGGYPCGLWTLFHTLLANSNRAAAQDTLQTVHAWVTTFFGCSECANHFHDMWNKDKGESQQSDMDAGLWLWHAHNKVRARLHREDDTTTGKTQWPAVKECEECYEEASRNGTAKLTSTEYFTKQWREGYVFQYLQEIYCPQSDLLPCAGFWDPSGQVQDNTMWSTIGIIVLCVLMVALAFWCICMDDEEEEEEEIREKKTKQAVKALDANMRATQQLDDSSSADESSYSDSDSD